MSLFDIEATTIDGAKKKMGDYAGKVMLIVNVASRCGFTPQYAGLEALHRKFADRNFVVLGFPCNQFGAQEPGTEADIKSFCTSNYGVRFPMFAKIDVNGAGAHGLYQWLTSEATAPDGAGPIKWNFAKFLVGKEGRVLARFAPTVDPGAAELTTAVERALG